MKCDTCGEELTERENEIYNEINDDTPCYCNIVKRINKLENLTKHNNDFKPDCKKCEMEVRYKCKEKNEVDMVKDCPYNPS